MFVTKIHSSKFQQTKLCCAILYICWRTDDIIYGAGRTNIAADTRKPEGFLVSEAIFVTAIPHLISSVRQLICSLVHSAVILHYHLNPLTRHISAAIMPTHHQALYSLPSHHHPVLHCRLQCQLQD